MPVSSQFRLWLDDSEEARSYASAFINALKDALHGISRDTREFADIDGAIGGADAAIRAAKVGFNLEYRPQDAVGCFLYLVALKEINSVGTIGFLLSSPQRRWAKLFLRLKQAATYALNSVFPETAGPILEAYDADLKREKLSEGPRWKAPK